MQAQPASRLCNLRQTPEKGLGLFAKTDIKVGDTISDEIAIKHVAGDYEPSAATWENPDFWENFRTVRATILEEAMSRLVTYYEDDSFQQDVLRSLSRTLSGRGLSDLANVFFSNCQFAHSQSRQFTLLFGPTTCAFNHSCVPNAVLNGYPMNDPTKSHFQVIALKDIKADAEITVSYRYITLPAAGRRPLLRKIFGFECACDVCMTETADIRDSFANMERLAKVVEAPLEDKVKETTPWVFFKAAHEMAQEFSKVDIQDVRLPRLFEQCALVSALHSDAVRTHHFSQFAANYYKNIRPAYVARLLRVVSSPHQHPNWGHTEMGLSRMEDDPSTPSKFDELVHHLMMGGHDEESYDRIRSKAEVFTEKERLAEEAANELLAEEEMEKGNVPVANPAKKKKKKNKKAKKQGGKKEPAVEGDGEGEAVGFVPAEPEVRLNTWEEEEDGGAGWEKVGEKKSSQQRAVVAAPTVPVAKKEKKVKPVAAVAAAVEQKEEKKKGKEKEKEEREVVVVAEEERKSRRFSVGEAAVSGEEGMLGRLRGYSQPPPFSPAARYDEGALVLPEGGRAFSRRCAAYIPE